MKIDNNNMYLLSSFIFFSSKVAALGLSYINFTPFDSCSYFVLGVYVSMDL